MSAPATCSRHSVCYDWETDRVLIGKKGDGPQSEIAISDRARYFAFTGQHLDWTPETIEPRHQPYLLETQFASTASQEAAAATAASRVLSNIISTVPERIAFPNRASLLESVETEYEASLAAIPDGPSKTQGIDAGNASRIHSYRTVQQ